MNAKTIVSQQLEAMKAMKERIKKYGYLLPEKDKNYLMEKVEESLRKCQIYVDMETKIEEAGLEPKPEPKKFTPPTRPTIVTPPPAKKKPNEPEQLSLMDMFAPAAEEIKEAETKATEPEKTTEPADNTTETKEEPTNETVDKTKDACKEEPADNTKEPTGETKDETKDETTDETKNETEDETEDEDKAEPADKTKNA